MAQDKVHTNHRLAVAPDLALTLTLEHNRVALPRIRSTRS